MPAPPRRGVPKRPARSLLALFSLTVVLPGVLLAVFGLRTLWQERQFADQQLRERLNGAADGAMRDLEREVQGWQDALEAIDIGDAAGDALPARMRGALQEPGAAVFVRVDPAEPRVWPERQLLYNPSPTVVAGSRLPPDPLLVTAEHAELRDRDYARAVRLYQRAVAGSAPERHATALHRLARTFRKAGRDAEALAAYEQLASSTDRIGVLPAELIARFEVCVLLAEQGKSDALNRTALALYRDLVAGRWWLEKARFAHYARRARQWLASDTASADELSRWAAIEERKGTLTLAAEAVLATGTLHGATTTDAVAVIQARAGRPVALLLSREWLSTTIWPQTFASAHASGFDIALLGPGTQVWFGSRGAAEPTLVAIRVTEDGRVPWRVRVTPRDPAAFSADVTRRQTVYRVMLVMIVALLGFGSYFTTRVVKRELEVAKLQSDFVSTVSHEFRSPLTAIRQLGELLARGRVPTEGRRQEYYERITGEADRLARLVENILEFSQMEDGRRPYHFERLDTVRWLRSVVDETRALGVKRAVDVVATVPDSLPPLRADQAALSSAVHNLIDNAVKYSPDRDIVWLDAEARDGKVSIRVRDEGVGVSDADRRRIFEKFYRADAEITRQVKGAGLGLSLVQHIVQAHGGTVECESRVGHGTTFTIRLDAANGAAGGG
jgi:signal transduction histidine kinase